ncbi:hypothetical protein CWS72_11955 [Telmatospirillum siberiense]|uniref:Uncharacterized protein n=1 Tax=Telmatospirillum siberiense TaxID=382514 RepID=A0A2N3PV70_9PROT|nr:hypothetical protein CWS72_11955 [Telmatospirillum siberiense]
METKIPEFDRPLAAAAWGAPVDGAGRTSHFRSAHDAGFSSESFLSVGRMTPCPSRTGIGDLSLSKNGNSHFPTTQNRGF